MVEAVNIVKCPFCSADYKLIRVAEFGENENHHAYTCAMCLAKWKYGKVKAGEQKDFPQPQRKCGEEPCGECRLMPGEVCDICGAKQTTGVQKDG